MSKSCPIIAINDAPRISDTPPNHLEWLELHNLANKFRGIYEFAEYPSGKDISFFLQLPDSSEIIKVRIYTQSLKAILIEADFLSESLSSLHYRHGYSYDITQNISRHFLQIAFVNKNKLSKKELAQRDELELPSPGNKRLRYVSITEKRPGLPLIPIDQSHASLVKLILTFACRHFNQESLELYNSPYPSIFKHQSGSDQYHAKSWKKSRYELPTLAEYYHLPLTEENQACKLLASPKTWTILCNFIPIDCPCPEGDFQPILLSYLHPQTKEPEFDEEKPSLVPFKRELTKDLSHLSEAIVRSLHYTLAEVSEKPTHILTTSPIVYHAILKTLKTSGISLVFTHDTSYSPYASEDEIYNFLYTSEDEVYQSLGYPLITQTKAVLHIKLNDVSPSVTRTIEVAGDISLDTLHHHIQSVMGWEDDHPHEFSIKKANQLIRFSNEELSLDMKPFIKSTSATTLNTLYQTGCKKLTYLYDFGDNWEHAITIRSLSPTDAPPKNPILLNSQGDCPEEDSRCSFGAW
jgi:hypothetical protein